MNRRGVMQAAVAILTLSAALMAWQLTAYQILARYWVLMAWPLNLSADYSYQQIPPFSGSLGLDGVKVTEGSKVQVIATQTNGQGPRRVSQRLWKHETADRMVLVDVD